MKKDFKKFLILLILSIFIAFIGSFSYSVYNNYKREKKSNQVNSLFELDKSTKNDKVEVKNEESNSSGDVNSRENWNNLVISEIEKNYVFNDIRPFYKRWYDKIRGKKILNYKSMTNENLTLVVEMKDNLITEKFFDGDKEILENELTANDDFSSYDLKSNNLVDEYTATYKDVLGKDTYLNTKNGLVEYKDGTKIEFSHKNAVMNGPAVETLTNGDKIEFNYVDGKRYGEAQKFYTNGDKEDFFYGKNEKKNGASVYYFANGEREEVSYQDGVLNGPAIYIFNDGLAEYYQYKNGKRVED